MQEVRKRYSPPIQWNFTHPETGMVTSHFVDSNNFFQRCDTHTPSPSNPILNRRNVLVENNSPDAVRIQLTIIHSEKETGRATTFHFKEKRTNDDHSHFTYSVFFTPGVDVSNKSYKATYEQGRLSKVEIFALPETADSLKYYGMDYDAIQNQIQSQNQEVNIRELAEIFKKMGHDYIFHGENAACITNKFKRRAKGKIHTLGQFVESILTPSEMRLFFTSLLSSQPDKHVSFDNVVSHYLFGSYIQPLHLATLSINPQMGLLSVTKSFNEENKNASVLPFSGDSKIFTTPYVITPLMSVDQSGKKICMFKIQPFEWRISEKGREKIATTPSLLEDGELLVLPFLVDQRKLLQQASNPSNKKWPEVIKKTPITYYPQQRNIH